MILGVPKEIKNNENRVGMTPSGVAEVVKHGHSVYVQTEAGVHSGFSDEAYVAAGACILSSAQEVYAAAEMIVKVKEPISDVGTGSLCRGRDDCQGEGTHFGRVSVNP